MQTLRMKEGVFREFLEHLKGFGRLVAPVEVGPKIFSLEIVDDVSRVRPEALRTILHIKKFLLKPKF
ncbi:MAG: hypothetical protein NZ869_11395, partial [Thermoanaerobaculum sp.]|nr:hypothetical protein [Thermoanaerobaculum sp.]